MFKKISKRIRSLVTSTCFSKPSLERRKIILISIVSVIFNFLFPRYAKGSSIIDIRIWPSRNYTRITIELDQQSKNRRYLLSNPNRLVVDLYEFKISQIPNNIFSKIFPNDPHIKFLRISQYKFNIVRMVFDLKKQIYLKYFKLMPINIYKYRIVFDLFSINKSDPIMNFIIYNKRFMIKKKYEKQFYSYFNMNSQFPVLLEDNNNNLNKIVLKKYKKKINPNFIIVIDPGHGGEDPGAIGKFGSYEKNIALNISKEIYSLISNSSNMKAIMTRDSDFFIPLNERVKKACKENADLFISIHANSFKESSVSGSSIFILSPSKASSSMAYWVAKKENLSDLIGGINIKEKDNIINHILFDMSTTAQIRDSMQYANFALQEISLINKLHNKLVEQAAFTVLKAPNIPSVLIETGFISNPYEEEKLNNKKYQKNIAQAILHSIKRYFSFNSTIKNKKNIFN